jgi:hypothetical protein
LFENGVIRKISGPKNEETVEAGRNYILRRFMIFIPHEIRCVIKSIRMRWLACGMHWDRRVLMG